MYKVLIVDDEPEIRNGLSQYFPWNSLSFEVAGTAKNGVEALQFLQTMEVNVILCDIKMPEMSGLELARRLYEQNSKTKMVLLSSYREFEYAQRAIEYNVRYYLVKPTRFERLSEVFTMLRDELGQYMRRPRAAADKPGRAGEYYETLIQNIKEYINENYKTATLKSTAHYIGMNPYYLSSFFKQHTKEMFSEYLTAFKMKKAADLLLQPHVRIHEICEELGYSTANNFSRSFKAFYQMSPSEFRHNHRIST